MHTTNQTGVVFFLPSQLYVGRHGESHGNAWAASGCFVCPLFAAALRGGDGTLWCGGGVLFCGASARGERVFISRRLPALFHAHRCSFQLEGITDDMYRPGTTLRLL